MDCAEKLGLWRSECPDHRRTRLEANGFLERSEPRAMKGNERTVEGNALIEAIEKANSCFAQRYVKDNRCIQRSHHPGGG
jgi:hypothetical protein